MGLDHFEKLRELVQEAEVSGLLTEARDVTGFSGNKLIGTLQRIAKYQESVGAGQYLEIGVFQGLTLISVASVLNEATAFGIDNFAQFDPDRNNMNIINKRVMVNNLENIRLINMDYEDALENLTGCVDEVDLKIGTYFIDGPHDYRSQLLCLQLAKPYLSDLSVIVVDDCNYRHVRLANRDFLIANPEFKMLFEAYTRCHPGNMERDEEQKAREGWWNGVNIIVHDPDGLLGAMVPEAIRDRSMYENEHIVHSAKYGFLAPEAVSFLSSLMSFRLIGALKDLMRVGSKIRKTDKQLVGKYASINTFSEQLPQSHFNPTLL